MDDLKNKNSSNQELNQELPQNPNAKNENLDNSVNEISNEKTKPLTLEERGIDPENPNEMTPMLTEVPEHKEVKETKADEIDGEMHLLNKVTELTYFKPIQFVYDGLTTIDEEIETIRLKSATVLKKNKTISIIATVTMLLSLVAGLIVAFTVGSKETWISMTVIGIVFAIVIACFVITTICNKKDSKTIREFLTEYEDALDGYLLYGLDVEDPVMCPDAKVDETSFIQAHCYRTITSIDSRSVVIGKRHNRNIQISEMAVVVPPVPTAKANELPNDYINLDGTPYIPQEINNTLTGTTELNNQDMTMVDLELSDEANNTNSIDQRKKDEAKVQRDNNTSTNRYGLFGRFCSYELAVSSEESMIIYILGEKKYNMLPDYLTGFKAVKVPGLASRYVVFLADVTKSSSFFDEKSIKLLNEIVPNQVFQSGFISINSYGTKIGMNLSDDLMNIPVKKKQKPGTVDAYKEANDKVFQFIDHLEEIFKK